MKKLIPIALLLITFSSCRYLHNERIDGDGNLVKENRKITGFNSIDVGGSVDVYLRQDSVWSVEVEIDNNLQPYIEVYKDGDRLKIHQTNNTNLETSHGIKVYVSAPSLEAIDVSGASKLIGENRFTSGGAFQIHVSGASTVDIDVKSPKIQLEATGASSAIVKGETKNFTVEGHGSSEIKAFDMLSENAVIDVSGASSADIFASVTFEGEASGASDVRFKGSGNFVAHTSGASSIKKVTNNE